MHPPVDPVAPAVELQLEIERVREPATRLEVRAHESVRSLEHPLRLRIASLEDHPARLQLPAERRELGGRSAAAGDRSFTVPDQLLRQHPEPTEATADAPEDVRRLLGEDQRAGDHPRPAQLHRHDVPAAQLPVTDRDPLARLPQIALHQLPRPIDRPLKRAPHLEPRTDLADVVIEDRLPALIAQLARHLPQPQRLNARVSPQLLANPVLERIELRPRRRALVARRHLADQRPRDRVAMHTREAMDRPLRALLDEIQPPDLSPLLHADHTLPPSLDRSIRRGSGTSRTAPTQRQMVQFSTGAGGPVFSRRPQARRPAPPPKPRTERSLLLAVAVGKTTQLSRASRAYTREVGDLVWDTTMPAGTQTPARVGRRVHFSWCFTDFSHTRRVGDLRGFIRQRPGRLAPSPLEG